MRKRQAAAGRSGESPAQLATDRQRAIFAKLLADRGITPADVARDAGFKGPNLLYNFLNGHTEQFSQTTLRKLSQTLNVPVSVLMGVDPPPPPPIPATSGLIVRSSAAAGVWRESFDLPLEQQYRAPIEIDQALRSAGAYGVVVRGRGAEKLYTEGSVLVVVPLDRWDGNLCPGRRVVLQRIRDLVEVTVRELDVVDGRAWLWPRSTDPTDPDCIVPIEMPWPGAAHMWRKGEDRFIIAGVVEQSLTIGR